MSWADFYLICFVLGFALSVLSLLGSLHLHLGNCVMHRRLPLAGNRGILFRLVD